MKNKLSIYAGSLILATGIIWTLLWLFLPIGINDAEARTIRETGLPSNAELLAWSEWSPLETENIQPYATIPRIPTNAIPKHFRFGIGKNLLGSFGFYQIKYILQNGKTCEGPALGPKSWAKMNFTIPAIVVTLGATFIIFGLISKQGPQ